MFNTSVYPLSRLPKLTFQNKGLCKAEYRIWACRFEQIGIACKNATSEMLERGMRIEMVRLSALSMICR